jgi:hypothetical protein
LSEFLSGESKLCNENGQSPTFRQPDIPGLCSLYKEENNGPISESHIFCEKSNSLLLKLEQEVLLVRIRDI